MGESRATASTTPSSSPPVTASPVSCRVSSMPFHRNGALVHRMPKSKLPNIYCAPTVMAPAMRVRLSTMRMIRITRPVTRQ